MQVTSQLLDGLEFMHGTAASGRSVLVVSPRPTWWVKITDFGPAPAARSPPTCTCSGIGTPGLKAPELILVHTGPGISFEEMLHTKKADMWPLGETVVRMMTANQPDFGSLQQQARIRHSSIDEKLFCVHGGLGPELNTTEQIRTIATPVDSAFLTPRSHRPPRPMHQTRATPWAPGIP